jgi:hypothetical protein
MIHVILAVQQKSFLPPANRQTHMNWYGSPDPLLLIYGLNMGVSSKDICSSTSWVLAFKLLIDGIKQFPWYHLLKYILIKTHLRSQSPTPIYKMCISIFSSHFILNRQYSVATKKNEWNESYTLASRDFNLSPPVACSC